MLTPDRPVLTHLMNSRLQVPCDNLRPRSLKIVEIRHTLLPLFRTQPRKDSHPIDGCRGLQRLRPPGIIFQAVINGDLLEVKVIDQTGILLENGRRLECSKPLHIRQGYTITSQTSQGHERAKMFGFLPVSATSQINAVQMLVSLSRASQEVRLYTDSSEVLKEAARQTRPRPVRSRAH